MTKHTMQDLLQMQSLPLEQKIKMTKRRIREWYEEFEGNVYVSFSGGKDNTVLLDICRELYPDIEAVFVDTGLEYPEIRKFVKTKENVTWLKPKMNFKQVIQHYGYPVISKEQSSFIREYRHTNSEKLKKIRIEGNSAGIGKISKKWYPLIDAPFEVGGKCCDVMKKRPSKAYEKQTGKKPIIGTMAEESRLRKSQWLQDGCNAFDAKRAMSKPMSFWTEQDVLQYIVEKNIPYSSIYGDIIKDYGEELEGQIEIKDLKVTDKSMYIFRTTGAKRTGCMFCMFGCHLEQSPNRFERMKETHPKIYEYCMKPLDQGGLGLDEVLNYINVKH